MSVAVHPSLDHQATTGVHTTSGESRARNGNLTTPSDSPALLDESHHETDQTVRRADSSTSEQAQVEVDARSTCGLLKIPDMTGFTELRIWAESYEDAQKARIACTNRMERGGIDPDTFRPQLEALQVAEHQFQLALGRCYRRVVPAEIRAWQKDTFGVGAHLLARLLGTLGHPRIATPYHWETGSEDDDKRILIADPPFERTVRQLWSYCGHGDATRKRVKGMSQAEAFALGSPKAKMLIHLLAEGCIKTKIETDPKNITTAIGKAGLSQPLTEPPAVPLAGLDSASSVSAQPKRTAAPNEVTAAHKSRHLRSVYDEARVRYTDHNGWTLGHQHAAALRLVGKQLLAELWEAAA